MRDTGADDDSRARRPRTLTAVLMPDREEMMGAVEKLKT